VNLLGPELVRDLVSLIQQTEVLFYLTGLEPVFTTPKPLKKATWCEQSVIDVLVSL
jgi:hypothetical protein